MKSECRINIEGTEFCFSISKKGFDDGGDFWTDAAIEVENRCFKYKTTGECFEFSELKCIRDKLSKLVEGRLYAVETLDFIEPDIQIILKPKYDSINDKKDAFTEEDCRNEYISAEFLFFPFLDGMLTEQYYVLPFDENEIKIFLKYLTEMIEKLD